MSEAEIPENHEQPEQPVWKIAAKDSSHPLHEATWTLFREKFNVKRSAARLEPQKQQVIDYMMQIITTPGLENDDSFGEGYAPINSVKLLGYWQVTDAIPHLVKIVENDPEAMTIIYSAAAIALGNMGEAAVEPMFAFYERNPYEVFAVASILGEAGRKNDRVYAFILEQFEAVDPKERDDVDVYSSCLLGCDKERAIPYLQELLAKRNHFSKDAREVVKEYIKMAQDGFFDRSRYDF